MRSGPSEDRHSEKSQKSVEESETLNSIKELTEDIYSDVDNENDTDFGQNGFLSADRFKSGDCLPLLNDKIQENLDLPKLEFCDYGDCNQVRNDSLDDKNNVDDLWSAVEEGINKIEVNIFFILVEFLFIELNIFF
uniref:Uncharacterized protein n=1 Tax=Meloidogyne hapla TaxID=6305 RepID=A0A1I8AYU2_MELHA